MIQLTARRLSRLVARVATTGAVVLASAVLLPTSASAQGDPSVEIARQRFREGVEHYDQRDYEKARLAFLQAYALKPHPAVLLNLAQSELRGGYPADAANHFAAYLRENPNATEAEKQEAELGFAAAKSKAGAVEVAVDVEGADILVDGEKMGRAPMDAPIYLSPGKHEIQAQNAGKSASTTVSVEAGDSVGATLRLVGGSGGGATTAPAAEPPPVEDEPDMDVGAYDDSSSRDDGFFAWYGDRPLAWVLTGVGVAGLAGGTILVISAKNSYDTADNLKRQLVAEFARDVQAVNANPMIMANLEGQAACSLNNVGKRAVDALAAGKSEAYENGCQRFEDASSEGDLYQALGIAGFGVGVLALGGIIVYYAVDDDPSDARGPSSPLRASVTPVWSDGFRGLSVTGTF